jgi:hypothetical protein
MGPAQPQSLLCGDPNAKLCVENASETQKERKSSKTDKRKSSSRTCAMRTVEFKTEMSGEKGLNCRPFSPDPSSRL